MSDPNALGGEVACAFTVSYTCCISLYGNPFDVYRAYGWGKWPAVRELYRSIQQVHDNAVCT